MTSGPPYELWYDQMFARGSRNVPSSPVRTVAAARDVFLLGTGCDTTKWGSPFPSTSIYTGCETRGVRRSATRATPDLWR